MTRCSGLTPYELKKLHSSYKENRSETRFELWEFLFILLNSLLELKTFIIMAKFELKFIDHKEYGTSIQVHELDGIISVFATDDRQKNTSGVCIHLDKSTAIKFAKTLRTEINKITESEVSNG